METKSIIVLCTLIVGIFFFANGLFGLMRGNTIRGFGFSIIGILFMTGFIFLSFSIGEERKEALINELATLLDTIPEKIIVEDISESSASFLNRKNEKLRKVYYDGKTYIAELESNKVIKLIEMREASSSK